jgi:3-dehydroquinate synthase
MTHHTIHVDVPGGSYPVEIAPGLITSMGDLVSPSNRDGTVFLVVDAAVESSHGAAVRRLLADAGLRVHAHVLPARESLKTLDTVRTLYDAMLAARLRRSTQVVAVGGGIVGDTAGFAAATYLRGVSFVQVPTTLLAMVDASIGGKTGVNHPIPDSNDLGKNVIGAFWQPAAVIIDPRTLETLDDRHFRCGLAECVKHGMIADRTLLDDLESSADVILSREESALTRLIERSARVKIGVVSRDEREAGPRALLNLGHTFAHAIEPIQALDLHHGEAVAIGLCAASHVAVEMGRLAAAEAERIERLLTACHLPVRMRSPLAMDRLLHRMSFDKKADRSGVRLVVPSGLGTAEVLSDVPGPIIERAWTHVGAA